jgi:hypothetical protein
MPTMKALRFAHQIAGGSAHVQAFWVRLCAIAGVALFWFPLPARTICSVVPRVCTEFFRSTAVFSGAVVSERDWYPPPDSDVEDARTYYKLKVETVYRGTSQEFIEVYFEDNSGRMGLEVGHEYLLFALMRAGQLLIGCGGNSAELKDASGMIREIRRLMAGMQSAHGGDIGGLVRFSYSEPNKGIPGLRIIVEGNGHTYVTRTNGEGRFHLHVPEGQHVARVDSEKWRADRDDNAYEDPDGFRVEKGGCADLILFASPKQPSAAQGSGWNWHFLLRCWGLLFNSEAGSRSG